MKKKQVTKKEILKGAGIAIEVTKYNPLKLLQKKIALKEERRMLVQKMLDGKHRIYELSIEINEVDDVFDKVMLELLKKEK